MGLSQMKLRMSSTLGSQRQEMINDGKFLFDIELKNDPSYCDKFYKWKDGKTQEKLENIQLRKYNEKYNSSIGYTMNIQTSTENTLHVGDYLFNEKDDNYWICTEVYDIGEMSIKAKLLLCNTFIQWQDSDGSVFKYHCGDINCSKRGSGESEDKVMTVQDGQHSITLPTNEDVFTLNSTTRLFMDKNTINPAVYRVTQIDNTSNAVGNYGTTLVTLSVDKLNVEKDRIDLWLCDYQTPVTPPTSTPTQDGSCKITYKGNCEVKSGGSLKKFTAVFMDSNGVEIDYTTVNLKWKVTSDTFDVGLLNKAEQDNYVSFKFDNDNLIAEKFSIKLYDEDGIYGEYTLTVDIVSIF